jgi:hypothetical protein
VKFGLYGLHKGENTAPEALARRAAPPRTPAATPTGDACRLIASLDGREVYAVLHVTC